MNETNTTRPLALDQRMIDAANSASQHNAGSVLAREAEQVYADGLKAFEPRPDWTPEQHAYAARRADEWRALVEESYNDIIRRRASWMPWTVCGPARYDSRKNNAKADGGKKCDDPTEPAAEEVESEKREQQIRRHEP